MSDEGSMSLEDDAPPQQPTPPETPTPEAVAAAPETPAEEPQAPDVEVDGQKMVPLPVLLKERQQAKTEAESLKQRLAQVEQLAQQQAPFVDFLRQNQHLMQPRQPEAAPAPTADPAALRAAKMYDFYKPDGTLDLDRGAQHVAMLREEAQAIAAAQLAPLQQNAQQQQSQANLQQITAQGIRTPDGRMVKPTAASLNAVWAQLPPHYTADPQIAAAMGLFALGLEQAVKQDQAPAPPPVVVTEASGGQPNARPSLSPLAAKFAADRGKTEKQWSENLKGFSGRRDRASVLED